ncbi:MAG TPA: hydrogenase maturation nickel metallochaperone HypA [Polyangiaceae bacterium LLY-WYZ-14_1]|jgi:hydrogenase nickel incorporation protein HypA/HybF|nr:hydrogenase maturation nickel metallochaperone HypA [Polyangiaceae bacterium LLY-WYZ-14_1]
MHELGITRNIVRIVDEHAADKSVKRVVLQIGALSEVLPDAVLFCFEICAKGTACEGAELVIERPPGRGRCRRCGRERPMETLVGGCDACDGAALEVVGGQELLVKEMEV